MPNEDDAVVDQEEEMPPPPIFALEVVRSIRPRSAWLGPLDALDDARADAKRASEEENSVEVRLYQQDGDSRRLIEVYRRGERS